MQRVHTPHVDARYWTAITLASVFGTNMGDLYAHETHLGIVKGLAVLAFLTAVVFVSERLEQRRHEVYYWLVILLIRTGATNIADYLAYRVRVPELALTASLLALLAIFGWGTRRNSSVAHDASYTLPPTNAPYWLAMLTAGVFGTVVGDICEHRIGEGISAVLLTVLLLLVLLAGHGRAIRVLAVYWATVAVARTAGTAIGDWIAENKIVPVGLRISTLLSGLVFLAILAFWKTSVATREPGGEATR